MSTDRPEDTSEENTPAEKPMPAKRRVQEKIFDVFRSHGPAELSSTGREKKFSYEEDIRQGPKQLREMTDATGPVTEKNLQDTHALAAAVIRPDTTLQTAGIIDEIKKDAAEKKESAEPDTDTMIHLQTFTINMTDRIARMKSLQKETREKMEQLEEDSLHPTKPAK